MRSAHLQRLSAGGRAMYALAGLALLAVEVMIALFVRDGVIRPYVGDVLAVALVYAVLRAATPLGRMPAAGAAMVIALVIEAAQAFDVLGQLGLGGNRIARIVLGGAFDVLDLVAYAAGAVLALCIEAILMRRNST